MSLEIARSSFKAAVKKLTAKEAPFIYAEKASDGEPVVLVGEANKPLPGPVVAAVRKGAQNVVSGFVAKGKTGVVFRVNKGTLTTSMSLALKKVFVGDKVESLLAKEFLQKAQEKGLSETEETEALAGAASMMRNAERYNALAPDLKEALAPLGKLAPFGALANAVRTFEVGVAELEEPLLDKELAALEDQLARIVEHVNEVVRNVGRVKALKADLKSAVEPLGSITLFGALKERVGALVEGIKNLPAPEGDAITELEKQLPAIREQVGAVLDAQKQLDLLEVRRKQAVAELKGALERLKKTQLDPFRPIGSVVKTFTEDLKQARQAPVMGEVEALESRLKGIEADAYVASSIAVDVGDLPLEQLVKERDDGLQPAVDGWAELQRLLQQQPLDADALAAVVAGLEDIVLLRGLADDLRRKAKRIGDEIEPFLRDTRNRERREFADRAKRAVVEYQKKYRGRTLLEAEVTERINAFDALFLECANWNPKLQPPPVPGPAYKELSGGAIEYKGNTYQRIHIGVYGCIKPGTCEGAVLQAYQKALTNGVISTFGTGESGVKKKGSSWEIKVRRSQCEALGLGTSARIDGKVTIVSKIGGGGSVKFVLFDTFFDAH